MKQKQILENFYKRISCFEGVRFSYEAKSFEAFSKNILELLTNGTSSLGKPTDDLDITFGQSFSDWNFRIFYSKTKNRLFIETSYSNFLLNDKRFTLLQTLMNLVINTNVLLNLE